MSKIDEMAKAHAKYFPNYFYDECGVLQKDTKFPALDYKAGALEVLKEIEKVLVAACEQYTSKQAVALNTEIYNKIKELKED